MSRGMGHVQRSILDLLSSSPDGAWSTAEICESVYRGVNRIEKKHRVAVVRALRNTPLPDPWYVHRLWRPGAEFCVYNECSVASLVRMNWLERPSWAEGYALEEFKEALPGRVKKAEERAAEAQQYHDADEAERIEFDLSAARRRLALGAACGWVDLVNKAKAEIEALEQRKMEVLT